jgi:adenine phosphoribosyltransferase
MLGIMFQDITTLLLDTKAFKDTIDLFVERYRDQNISVVAGIIHDLMFLFA